MSRQSQAGDDPPRGSRRAGSAPQRGGTPALPSSRGASEAPSDSGTAQGARSTYGALPGLGRGSRSRGNTPPPPSVPPTEGEPEGDNGADHNDLEMQVELLPALFSGADEDTATDYHTTNSSWFHV